MKRTLAIHFITLVLSFGVFTLAGWSEPAWALSLQEAKAQGLVGEKLDGYLGMVKSSAEVKALVTQINQKRKKHYAGIAKRNGTSVDVVEVLAGKKAIEKTPVGQYIQNPSGNWVKK